MNISKMEAVETSVLELNEITCDLADLLDENETAWKYLGEDPIGLSDDEAVSFWESMLDAASYTENEIPYIMTDLVDVMNKVNSNYCKFIATT